ncbi:MULTISPECIES: dTDP-4-dehydrorhamnose reductase [Dethiosulfovibrio]|uniref:dTDP-4-dehydrorhamnose reductase n=2 Tax=Dethiosulfovibrio TaxID=47054 RepID=A0ABS9EPT6_9BACT|nr:MULTISPECIES: dTDP-4-dehydrorhamnose reductase [Dethiosulfovibrio]MCF4113123.1 dTDP-4-dehydrorhamnose reductase [Dethiosulfovibrio russensis]MCF4142187.1 dTDP-4-dehydrorhamnose reductase [Dethiosulfovibrio marinus]MCF4145852.1 dTDP-4-dehydrorhamnose reductase [Dethiosulfovibrio acidaminovorans]
MTDILLTGCNGMLGQEVHSLAKKTKNTVIAIDIKELDITEQDTTSSFIHIKKPNIVINCAAYTNVDGCETDEDNAFKVNAIGPRNLAMACEEIGASLVHISTDYVFDGTQETPYDEYDIPSPQSAYGRTKYAGERLVAHCCSRSYIIRTAWLYGIKGKNFVSTMLQLAKSGKPLKVVDDQIGSPTYAKDLAEGIMTLVEKPRYGIYHFTNAGFCSWYDFAKEIFDQAGLEVDLSRCTTDEFPRPAKRPAFSKLKNNMGPAQGLPSLRPWQEGLRAYLNEIDC